MACTACSTICIVLLQILYVVLSSEKLQFWESFLQKQTFTVVNRACLVLCMDYTDCRRFWWYLTTSRSQNSLQICLRTYKNVLISQHVLCRLVLSWMVFKSGMVTDCTNSSFCPEKPKYHEINHC
ncbi:hypothetical protein O6H91_08G016900 [Diphasiastrum complanatum]|uniref:Uncharacterized protein n=1 Tax=Diphasiastrum complanatum TaxID=34168 RepID=A0ACC2CVL9_DIPCM|nr:hypothetical protein O6H91_08G016900 [Diphasiastrum complanatum]